VILLTRLILSWRYNLELVEVGKFLSRESAEICRGLLEASSIHSIVLTDDMGGLRPHMAYASNSAVRLMVPEDRLAEAREILSYENEEDFADYWDRNYKESSLEQDQQVNEKVTEQYNTHIRRAFWSAVLGTLLIPVLGQILSFYQLYVSNKSRDTFSDLDVKMMRWTYGINL
jgi:hypothetical protein